MKNQSKSAHLLIINITPIKILIQAYTILNVSSFVEIADTKSNIPFISKSTPNIIKIISTNNYPPKITIIPAPISIAPEVVSFFVIL